MELQQVRYFLAVCDTKNFTRAAERCYVSQPALTSAIKKLEQELCGPLFVRERAGAKLTTLGHSVRPRFEEMIEQIGRVEDIARDHRLLKRVPLRLGILETLGPNRVAVQLEQFRSQAPEVEFELEMAPRAELLARLEEAELDVVLANADGSEPAWATVQDLYEEPYVVVLPPNHRLAARESIALADLSGERYIDRLGCELREQLNQVCEQQNVQLYAAYRTNREAWIECLVRAGLGFAFLPEHSVSSADTTKRPLVAPTVSRRVALMRFADRPMEPAGDAFWATMT
ncbi:MAG: LysR family transcriptional regulator [Planctomycetota bacterium]